MSHCDNREKIRMTTQETILIQILAESDAIHLPMRQRDWQPPTPAVIYERRRRFAASGICWQMSGDDARRKLNQRELARMKSAGLLELHGRERRSHVRLTSKGDTLARSLCGLPGLDASHATLCEVIRLGKNGTAELWLAGLDSYAEDPSNFEVILTENMCLPSLVRQWLVSHSDLLGHVAYFATPQGIAIAAQPEPVLPSFLPKSSGEAFAAYTETILGARAQLRAAKPERQNEIGPIPMIAGQGLKRRRGAR